MKVIQQTEASECGLACLAMLLGHFGHSVDLPDLRRKFSVSLKGATLAQLMRHAATVDLNSRPLRLDLDEMGELTLPCILHWNLNHFVVLKKVSKDFKGRTYLIILDPAVGERKLTLAEASEQFTGIALEVTPSPAFKPKVESRQIEIQELTGPIVGLRRAIVQVIALALALEVFAICAPLFNQFVIDEVIVSGDRDLLQILVIGFGLLMVTQTAIGLARSWFLMRWSMDISLQWSARVLGHLVRLPVSYFEKRHLGDVLSRFGSISAIQSTLTSVFVEGALDGLMAVLALGMLLMYSPLLTSIVVGAVILYSLVRWFFYTPFREASQERLILSAKEGSHFLETMRAITPLKLFGREGERLSVWQNLKMDVQNRDIKTQKLSIIFRISNTAIFGFQGIALFYVGAGLVIDNALSVGMLMAFTSYAATFTGRVSRLIDMYVSLKMLSMYGDRLADIIHEEAEPVDQFETDLTRIVPSVTVRNLRYRYGDGEPWILDGVSFTIEAGQSVALIGPSGCGKTTLCKLMLGLLKPTEGDILVGGIPIRQLGISSYRQLIGTVMQDDTLLAGSILDNICFFDTGMDIQMVEQCARATGVHDEIIAMPMGYQTLVGDMGSSLSGGQKQRILLARALYKRPKILALDEATSHLDVKNEKRVNQALAEMKLTRIMVAHRPETISVAERVIALSGGRIVESVKPDVGSAVACI